MGGLSSAALKATMYNPHALQQTGNNSARVFTMADQAAGIEGLVAFGEAKAVEALTELFQWFYGRTVASVVKEEWEELTAWQSTKRNMC